MATDGMLGYEDLFDLNDSSALQKILKALETIDKSYYQMTRDVLKYQQMIIKGQEDMRREMEKRVKHSAVTGSKDIAEATKGLSMAQKMSAELRKLKGAYASTAETINLLATEQAKIRGLQNQTLKAYSTQTQNLRGLTDALRIARKEYKSFGDTTSRATKAASAAQIKDLVKQIKATENALKTSGTGATTAAAAYKELGRQIKTLSKELGGMPGAFKSSSAGIKELQAELSKLTKERAKAKEAAQAEAGSIKALKKELADTKKAYEAMGSATSEVVKNDTLARINQLTASLKEMQGAMKTGGISEAGNSYLKLTDDINKLEQELNALPNAFGENAEAAKALALQIDTLSAKRDEARGSIEREAGSLSDIKKQLKDAELAYRQMGQATDETVKLEALQRISRLSEEVQKSERALKDAKTGVVATAGSYHALAREVQELNADLKNLPDVFGRNKKAAEALQKTIYSKTQQLKDFDKAVNQSYRNVGNYESAFKGLKGTIADALQIGSYAAFFSLVGAGFMKLIGINRDFEKSLSTLKAILGVSKEEMTFFREEALQIGLDLKVASSDVVEGFKLMGSASPELLKNKKALADTTKEAIILSQAAGIDVPDAVQALASTMNQFNLPAAEASRIINTLAAGSKVGAAEVPELTQAIDKAGTTAANFNVTVEESIAAVEVLSTANIKGAEAGTALRNVLLKMQGLKLLPKDALKELERFGVDIAKVTDETLPLEERMQELSKITSDATVMMRVFGTENINAATVLLQNTELFKQYTAGVTGTQTALEQQADALDNLDGDISEFSETLKNVIAEGSGFNNVIRKIVQGATQFVLTIREVPAFLNENKVAIGLLALGILSLNKALIVSAYSSLADAAAKTKQIIVSKAATIAQWNLNAALAANPIGAVVAAAALLVAGFITLYRRSEQVRAGLAGLSEVIKGHFVSIAENAVQILGGVGDIIAGVFTFDIDQIKRGMVSSFAAIKKVGEDAARNFSKGYNDQLTAEREAREKKEAQDVAQSGSAAGYTTKKTTTKKVLTQEELDKLKKEAEARRKAAEELHKQLLEIENKRVVEVGKINKRLVKAEQDLQQARIQEQIAALNQEISNEDSGNRIGALQKRAFLEKQLAKETADDKIALKKLELKELDQALKEELSKVEGNARLQEAVRISYIDRRLALEKAIAEEEKGIREALARDIAEIERKRLEETKRLRLEEARQAPEDQFANRTQTITRDFVNTGDLSGEAEKQYYEDLTKAHEQFLADKIAALQQAGASEEEIRKAQFEQDKYYLEKGLDEAKKARDTRISFLNQVQSAALDLMNGLFELQSANADARIAALEKERDKELENVALNEEGKARLQEKYDEKIKKIKLEQARREKQMSIFQATISMIQGIVGALSQVKTMGPGAFVLAALIGATGALNIAKIKKEPLPQFFKGTQHSPEGLAIVDEKGPELYEHGGKKWLGSGDGPRLTYLQKGTKIHPHHAPLTQKMLAKAGQLRTAQGEAEHYQQLNQKLESVKPVPLSIDNMQQIVRMEVGQELDRVVEAIRDIPVADLDISDGELKKLYLKANQGKRFRDNFFNRNS